MDIIQRKTASNDHSASMNVRPKNRLRRPSKMVVQIAGALALCAIGGGVWYVVVNQPPQVINQNQYQVVYLANGQAYFGKLKTISGDYLVMQGAYTAQTVQPKVADSTTSTTPTETSTTLLKVTNETYGPEDSIAIRASQVSFWQNLRDDSKVTQALKSKQ